MTTNNITSSSVNVNAQNVFDGILADCLKYYPARGDNAMAVVDRLIAVRESLANIDGEYDSAIETVFESSYIDPPVWHRELLAKVAKLFGCTTENGRAGNKFGQKQHNYIISGPWSAIAAACFRPLTWFLPELASYEGKKKALKKGALSKHNSSYIVQVANMAWDLWVERQQ